jgi:hypothetical protein
MWSERQCGAKWLQGSVELNDLRGFTVNSTESHLFNYNNLTILSAKGSIPNPQQKPLGGEAFAMLQTWAIEI